MVNCLTVVGYLFPVGHAVVPAHMGNPNAVIVKDGAAALLLCHPVYLHISPLLYTFFIFPKRKGQNLWGPVMPWNLSLIPKAKKGILYVMQAVNKSQPILDYNFSHLYGANHTNRERCKLTTVQLNTHPMAV